MSRNLKMLLFGKLISVHGTPHPVNEGSQVPSLLAPALSSLESGVCYMFWWLARVSLRDSGPPGWPWCNSPAPLAPATDIHPAPSGHSPQTLKLQATAEIWGGGVILEEICALKLVFTFFRHKPLDTGWYWWLLFQSSSNWFRHAVQKRNACFDFNFIKEMSSFLSILILCQQHK